MDYETFQMHYESMNDATAVYSYIVVDNPDYQAIVKGGSVVIPYILRKLDEDPSFYAASALREIEPSVDVPLTACSNLHQLKSFWLQWGKNNNYIA